MRILVAWLINALALFLLPQVFKWVQVDSWWAAVIAALVLGLAFFWQPELPERPLPMASAPAGGDFTLQSAGGPVALQDFRGKLVLVYFGYTYCPDICPTALAATAEGLKLLTPDSH